ncbi:MAG: aspartate carbamoyltransferase [Burkholderiaceae bacterium]|nr:MAG: aspartate carbamoyltransferase [Burkholderiaceae bacterium]
MTPAQQALLRDAMRQLGLTRDAFATRLGVTRRALDSWLLPEDSKEHRGMPSVVEHFVRHILAHAHLSPGVSPAVVAPESRHLLSVDQLDRGRVEHLFRLADLLQPVARRRKVCRVLEGAVLANLFFEASTRTRMSFGAAFCRLGGSVCDTTGFTFSSMAKGESIYDSSRVISGYADAMVIRHPEKGSVAEFARATNIPVINGGDGPGEHPSQALLDLYTIEREFSRLGKVVEGSCIAMVGDLKHGRTVHSLLKLITKYRKVRVALVAPAGLEMPSGLVEIAAATGCTIETHDNLADGLRHADVIYATRIQKERFSAEMSESLAMAYSEGFQINASALAQHAKADTIVMHPLPRDSSPGANDLSNDLNLDPRLAIFRQADNGIPVRMALFADLLGVAEQVPRNLRDVNWWTPTHTGTDDPMLGDLA